MFRHSSRVITGMVSIAIRVKRLEPFVSVSPEELVFGYDDGLTTLAHKFYPKEKRPPSAKMGLLLGVSANPKQITGVFTVVAGTIRKSIKLQ